MQTLRLTLPKRHIGQQQIVAESGRFNVLDCGRRFGKTVLGLDRCATPETLPYPVGWFSPTYKMLIEVWREAVRTFAPITERRSAQEHRLEFMTGGLLEFWSLDNPDSARGRKYRRIVVDEAALVPNLFDVWNFSLRPMLVDYSGDAFFLSTPRGLNGFWQLWQLGQDANNHEWQSWKMPTTANPHIPASEVEAMRLTMPERVFAQEMLAEFIDDAGGVFRKVRDAATAKERTETLNNTYVLGVDWGKMNDFTVVTVIDVDQMEMVKMDRFNQIDYTVQVGRLKAICEHWRPMAVVVERNSIGEPLIEQLIRDGLPVQPFTMTNATKAQVIDGLSLAFERSQLRILNDEVLINELLAYDMERLPSGLLRYGAPDGFHDDCVISLALAYYGANRGGDTSILNEAFGGW